MFNPAEFFNFFSEISRSNIISANLFKKFSIIIVDLLRNDLTTSLIPAAASPHGKTKVSNDDVLPINSRNSELILSLVFEVEDLT